MASSKKPSIATLVKNRTDPNQPMKLLHAWLREKRPKVYAAFIKEMGPKFN